MSSLLLKAGLSAAIVSAAVGAGPGSESQSPTPQHPKRPNFVIVMTDDQRVDEMGPMQATRSLLGGDQGVEFHNAFATEPLCCPARTTLLTGQYSHNHHVLSNDPPYGGITAFHDREKALPVWLDQIGYETALVGKYLNGPAPKGPEPGWDHFIFDPTLERYGMFNYSLSEDGRIIHFGADPADYKTDVETAIGQRIIRDAATQGRPFFLWMADVAPHDDNKLIKGQVSPEPAPRDVGTYEKADLPPIVSYNESDISDKSTVNQDKEIGVSRGQHIDQKRRWRLESLLSVDDQVRSLYETLEQTGQLENTVFIFTSDNGYMHGEHRLAGKQTPYEESVRIPLFIRGPEFKPGADRFDMVGLHDLTATITKMAGADPDRVLDGQPLMKPLSRNELLLECVECNNGQKWRELRDAHYSYFRYIDSGDEELYDTRNDPYQFKNIAEGRPGILSQMRARLAEVRECQGKECP